MQVWLSEMFSFGLLNPVRMSRAGKFFLFVHNLKFYFGSTSSAPKGKKFNPVYFWMLFILVQMRSNYDKTSWTLKIFFFINWSKELNFSEEFPQIKVFQTLKWSAANERHVLIPCGMYDHLSNSSRFFCQRKNDKTWNKNDTDGNKRLFFFNRLKETE